MLPDIDYKEAKSRKRIRKKQANDGSAPEAVLNPREWFRISTNYAIIDTLQARMKSGSEVFKEISNWFSLLNDMNLSDEQYLQGCVCGGLVIMSLKRTLSSCFLRKTF